MFENPIVLRCRPQDMNIVEGLIPELTEKYKEATGGKEIVLKLDTENNLPAETCGGIELFALRGKIKISNTLEARLELIAQQLVPQIRTALFGRNPNRKFTD